VLVAKELLDLAQVRAGAEELGGEHVAERVRRDPLALVHAGCLDVVPEDLAEFGARPLRRTIQRLVENELSRMVLDGSVQPGDLVKVDVLEGELHFDVESGGASELVPEREEEQARV